MNDVVGNLGEPIDFMEYRVDGEEDEDGEQHDGAQSSAHRMTLDMDQEGTQDASGTMLTDVDVVGSYGSGGDSADLTIGRCVQSEVRRTALTYARR